MQAHIELGCESTFTCAPYQSKHRPVKGQQIAWAESNAIVFANSVLGARTNRYGDFLDLCAAFTGRAPYSGLHLTENRYGQVLYELQDFPHQNDARDIWFAVLGLWVGGHVGNRIPVFSGLPLDTSEDELKALGASAAATGAVGLFHALGITPEATTLGDAFGGRDPTEIVPVSFKDLLQARQAMSATKAGDKLVAVSLGTPHFSLTEFNRLHQLLIAQNSKLAVDFYVNTSRFILWELEQTGLAQSMLNLGITIVTDTCTYITPIMRKSVGLVMTNSGKWAHYAPSTIGVKVAFGSLHECVLSAFKGEVVFNAN
jgi:predicted aconitase